MSGVGIYVFSFRTWGSNPERKRISDALKFLNNIERREKEKGDMINISVPEIICHREKGRFRVTPIQLYLINFHPFNGHCKNFVHKLNTS